MAANPSKWDWVNSMRETVSKSQKKPSSTKSATKTTSKGTGPQVTAGSRTSDNEYQKALKPYQKYGLPYESRGAAKPAPAAKATKTVVKKSKPASAPVKESVSSKRAAMKPIAGVANTGGMLTRTLPGGDKPGVDAKSVSKGVMATKRTYSDKEQKMAAILAKGKKKNGTMKASAQRKIASLRKK